MKSETAREKKMPEASDDAQVALADTQEPNGKDPTVSRRDPLSLDPYSPLPPISGSVGWIPAL